MSLGLNDADERNRILFDHNPVPMWVYDRATLHFLAFNDAAVKSYGYTREEFESMSLVDVHPAEDAVGIRQAVVDVNGGPNQLTGWRHRCKDGSLIDVEIVSHAVQFRGSDARIVLINNISSRLRAEGSARRSDELVRAILADAPLAIVTLDLDLVITRWNPAAERMLGGSEHERVGTPYASIVPPSLQDEHLALRDGILRGEIRSNLDTERLDRAGRVIPVSISLAALHDTHGVVNGIVVILADRREREALEARIRQSAKMEAVGQLAGGVAHDFNNLLTVISSYTQMLLAELPVGESQHADALEISAAAERAAALTRQLLTVSRQKGLRPELLGVNGVVRGLANMLNRLMREDIHICLDLHPDSGVVLADAGQLEQVLVNLVVNARDAMPEGGTLTIATCNVELPVAPIGRGGSFVQVSVTDSGTGMSPDIVARVFEPFFTTKEAGRGTGLGLATVASIVEQLGGDVDLDTQPGKGSTFRVLLPRRTESVPSLNSTGRELETRAAGETILIVEDDAALRVVAARVLKRQGYNVLEAHNGREALELIERNASNLRLVLADMVMPEMNGRQLAAELATRFPQLRIVLMSGYTPEVLFTQEDAHAAVAFLGKPFTPDSLRRAVQDALGEAGQGAPT